MVSHDEEGQACEKSLCKKSSSKDKGRPVPFTNHSPLTMPGPMCASTDSMFGDRMTMMDGPLIVGARPIVLLRPVVVFRSGVCRPADSEIGKKERMMRTVYHHESGMIRMPPC